VSGEAAQSEELGLLEVTRVERMEYFLADLDAEAEDEAEPVANGRAPK
jgi:hypothetical protein